MSNLTWYDYPKHKPAPDQEVIFVDDQGYKYVGEYNDKLKEFTSTSGTKRTGSIRWHKNVVRWAVIGKIENKPKPLGLCGRRTK